MQRLSGPESALLDLETPAAPLHAGALALLPATDDLFATLRARLSRLVAARPDLRRRLLAPPLGLGAGHWAEAGPVDPDLHFRRLDLGPAGDGRALANLVGRLHARPLERGRPLWALWLVEGLAGGGAALLAKVHAGSADGAGALGLVADLLSTDQSPAVEAAGALLPRGWRADPEGLRLKQDLVHGLAAPFAFAADLAGLAAGGLARRRLGRPAVPVAPFNTGLSPGRALAFQRFSCASLDRAAALHGARAEDALLAAAGGALRDWLGGAGALPDTSLVAGVPVAVHAGPLEDFGAHGAARAECARLGVVPVPLGTDLGDPAARLARVAAATRAPAVALRAFPAGTGRRLALAAGPLAARGAARLRARLGPGLAARGRTGAFNLVVSPLVDGGHADLPGTAGVFPLPALDEGAGLAIVMRAAGEWLDLCAVADGAPPGDMGALVRGIALALDALAEGAGFGETPARTGRGRRAAGR